MITLHLRCQLWAFQMNCFFWLCVSVRFWLRASVRVQPLYLLLWTYFAYWSRINWRSALLYHQFLANLLQSLSNFLVLWQGCSSRPDTWRISCLFGRPKKWCGHIFASGLGWEQVGTNQPFWCSQPGSGPMCTFSLSRCWRDSSLFQWSRLRYTHSGSYAASFEFSTLIDPARERRDLSRLEASPLFLGFRLLSDH